MDKNFGQLKEYECSINERINDCFSAEKLPYQTVFDAMKYSLSAGGKRIRPVLLLEFYRACGGKNDILNSALAVEFIHTYSLIHDDLPCMDDDDFRRGRPSCHKKFSENIAVLAGDALNTLAFETIANGGKNGLYSYKSAVLASEELSSCAGFKGMIGGQIIDLENENNPEITVEVLNLQNELKTGKLIEASCVMGVIFADGSEEKLNFAREYGKKLGLAFQIVDDILDSTSTFEELGKPINSDLKNKKSNYVSLLGLEKSRVIAEKLTNDALLLIENFENNEFLIYLTNMLLKRTK